MLCDDREGIVRSYLLYLLGHQRLFRADRRPIMVRSRQAALPNLVMQRPHYTDLCLRSFAMAGGRKEPSALYYLDPFNGSQDETLEYAGVLL